jgi:hypothetical protein
MSRTMPFLTLQISYRITILKKYQKGAIMDFLRNLVILVVTLFVSLGLLTFSLAS